MIALCLQCCPGDTDVAMDLAKLICELEPVPRNTEFVLVYRKDCNLKLPRFFEKLAGTRFKACARMARNHDVGWPGGANMLAQSSFMEMSILHQTGMIASDGFLLFEPDCIPLQRNWIDLLSEEWETTKALGKEAFGHWGPPEVHMNGNAVFSTTFFVRHSDIMIGASTQGWDYFYRANYLPISKDSDLILSHWQRYDIDQGTWASITKNGTRPALFHGIKTADGRALARANLLTQVVENQPK